MAGCGMHQTQTQTQPSSDSEEFSSFFDQLLQSSPPPPFDPNDSGSDFTRPDPLHSDFRLSHNPFQPSLLQNNAEASELSSKPPRAASSKRSRAAEFHNLSEKRRRSRINEKMKALQNLIPNSNKTDKASMLDEAIEYLKQLQLQVQMLMMRNGLSLHPMSLPGGMRPMLFPQTAMNLDDGNRFQNSSGAIASSANNESFTQHGFSFPKQCSISNQSTLMPSVSNIVTSDTSSIFQPPIKDALYSNMPQVFLDTTKIVRTPSPDVS